METCKNNNEERDYLKGSTKRKPKLPYFLEMCDVQIMTSKKPEGVLNISTFQEILTKYTPSTNFMHMFVNFQDKKVKVI